MGVSIRKLLDSKYIEEKVIYFFHIQLIKSDDLVHCSVIFSPSLKLCIVYHHD